MSNSARLALPLIETGQAQKEMFHNEALALIDLAIGACVEASHVADPPAAPEPGQAWIVGPAPGGAWQGHAQAVAGWTAGGWRFLPPFEGLGVWQRDSGTIARFVGGAWRSEAGRAIAAPQNGTIIDSEARAAIIEILAVLRRAGMTGA